MARYAVIGSSRGTGLAITRQLSAAGEKVRAISRNPPPAGGGVEPFVADVTDPASLARAFAGDLDAVFFTVDATGGMGDHQLFGSRSAIRAVTYQGCVNAIEAVAAAPSKPAFILLSVMGVDQWSLVWTMLDIVKTGSKRNVLDRELALKASGVPHVILRAPRLTDAPGGAVPVAATPPTHKLASMSLPRNDLARTMIKAARHAPRSSAWDVFADASGPVPDWLR